MYIVHNPMIGSDNTGDEIIMKSIDSQMDCLSLSGQRIDIPSHYYQGRLGRKYQKDAAFTIAAGSNMLGFQGYLRRQWKVSDLDLIFGKNKTLLFGVGWQSYHTRAGLFNKISLRRLLDIDGPHSVRDQFTADKLHSLGFSNVYNTGCPTMWELGGVQEKINLNKRSQRVIYTITNYNKDISREVGWLTKLRNFYKELIFWPQSFEDVAYHEEIEQNIELKPTKLECNLASFEAELLKGDLDYIGTRLHAGVFAMQKGNNALINAIDNRAYEISKDTNLPIFNFTNLEAIDKFALRDTVLSLNLDHSTILKFQEAFRLHVT